MTPARKALEQLVEMGMAECPTGRPTTYRQNDANLDWKRIELLAKEYETDELRARIASRIEEDASS